MIEWRLSVIERMTTLPGLAALSFRSRACLAPSWMKSWGEAVGEAFKSLANDVQTAVIPGAGHWFAEQAPEETLAALTEFLAPSREGGGGGLL